MPFLPPDKVFIVLAAAFGLLFVFLTPPFQVPDEPNHFYRAFQISEGQFTSVKQEGDIGGRVPTSLVQAVRTYVPLIFVPGERMLLEDLLNSWRQPLKPDERQFASFPNTAHYSPVPYLPQALGIRIGKTFNLPPVALLCLGRIFNLACWSFLVFVAIRLTPVYPWLLALLALMPMSLFEAASMSADAVTNGLAFLTIAGFYRCAFDRTQGVGKKELLTLTAVTVLLSFSKTAYFPALGLFLLIPMVKLGSCKRYFAAFALLVGANILALAAWSYFGDVAANLHLLETRLSPFPDTDHLRQLRFILADLPRYAEILGRTAINQFTGLSWQFVGILGWLDTPMPWIFVQGGFGLLFFCGIFENRKDVDIRNYNKGILCLYAIGTGVLMATMLYMTWTPVGAAEIRGLQGRYFIPVAPAFFALFYNRSLSLGNRKKYLPPLITAGILVLLLGAAGTLTRRYYDRQFFSGTFNETADGLLLIPGKPVKMSPAAGFASLQPTANISACRSAGDGLAFLVTSDDPQLLLPAYGCPDVLTIKIELTAPAATRLQLFYKTLRSRVYSEHNSVSVAITMGRQIVELSLPAGIFGRLRLDPGAVPGDYLIHSLEIRAEKPFPRANRDIKTKRTSI